MRGQILVALVAGVCAVTLTACGGGEGADVGTPGPDTNSGVTREAAEDDEVWNGVESINGCAIKVNLDCPGAQMQDTNLTNLDLSEADFQEADLSGADLAGTNLTGANLVGANLESANLTGANLSFANLSQAWLVEANLTGTNLTGVTFNETVMPDGTLRNS